MYLFDAFRITTQIFTSSYVLLLFLPVDVFRYSKYSMFSPPAAFVFPPIKKSRPSIIMSSFSRISFNSVRESNTAGFDPIPVKKLKYQRVKNFTLVTH